MSAAINSTVVPILYLVAAVLFMFGIKGLTKVRTARRGSATAALAMLLAVTLRRTDCAARALPATSRTLNRDMVGNSGG